MKSKSKKVYPIRADVLSEGKEVLILDQAMKWRGKQVSYANTPSIAKLFKIFDERPALAITRAQLMEAVYGDTQGRSQQFVRAVRHNLVKRISRARKFMRDNFSELSEDVDWFFYDQREECWRLYQYRHGLRQQ